jgi:SHS family lactate transporter-like MFS transporter
MLLMVLLGPESDGSHFEQAKVAFQDGAGKASGRELVDPKGIEAEKNLSEHVEQVKA